MNRYEFEYHDFTREFLVYLISDINGKRVLIGRAPNTVAQDSSKLFDWSDKQTALLGLSSAMEL